jgi:hypothetical protein
MIRTTLIAALIAVGGNATAALAQAAPAAPAAAHYSSETPIGTLLDDPAAKAVLDKYLPGFSTNPQIEQGRALTLKAIQGYAPDQFKDETIAKIDADLAKLPVKK